MPNLMGSVQGPCQHHRDHLASSPSCARRPAAALIPALNGACVRLYVPKAFGWQMGTRTLMLQPCVWGEGQRPWKPHPKFTRSHTTDESNGFVYESFLFEPVRVSHAIVRLTQQHLRSPTSFDSQLCGGWRNENHKARE